MTRSIPHAVVQVVGVLLLITAGAAAAVAPARFVRFREARPTLTELAGKLPPEVNTLTPAQMESAWPEWIERHDCEVRARLEQGDEDTIINWMLFGTSFTSRPARGARRSRIGHGGESGAGVAPDNRAGLGPTR